MPGIAPAIDEACASAPPAHAFLRRAWYAGAAGDGSKTVLGRRPDGSILAAIPLSPLGPKLLGMFMVPGSYWPFRSALVADGAEVAELTGLLRQPRVAAALGKAWRIGPVYADDSGMRALASAARAAGWTMLERRIGTTWVIDRRAPADRAAWPSGSTVRRVRAHQRQLEAHGPIALRFVSGRDWGGAVLDTLAAIEAQSWVSKSTDGSAAKFLKPEQRAVWETALADEAIAEMLSASILFAGETPVAFTFDLNAGGVQYGIATGYDERFAKCSPGKVIGLRNVEHAVARGVELFDWGCGDNGYKGATGAEAGSDIVDRLFVRSRAAAALIRKKWMAGGSEGAAGA